MLTAPLQILSAINAAGSVADGLGKIASNAAKAISGGSADAGAAPSGGTSGGTSSSDFSSLLGSVDASSLTSAQSSSDSNSSSSSAILQALSAALGGTDSDNSALQLADQNIQLQAAAATGSLSGINSVSADGNLLTADINGGSDALTGTASGSSAISNSTLEALNDILAGNDSAADISALKNSATAENLPADTNISANVNTDSNTIPDAKPAVKISEDKATTAVALVQPGTENLAAVTNKTDDTSVDDAGNPNNGNITSQLQAAVQNAVTTDKNAPASAKANPAGGKDLDINLAGVTGDASKNLQATIKDNAASTSKTLVSDNLVEHADKTVSKTDIDVNSNPNAAFFAHDINTASADVTKLNNANNDIKEKLAEIDTYKVVNVSKKDNVLDVKLDPEHLGKVQIKLDFASDGKANISVSADKQTTLDMLQKDAKSIQKILADNGVKADSGSMNFSLNQQGKNSGQGDFGAFQGKPLSFRVTQEVNQAALAANNNASLDGYGAYGTNVASGMVNIIV